MPCSGHWKMAEEAAADDPLPPSRQTTADALPVPARRILIVGASNVTLAFPLLLNACVTQAPCPVQLFTAHGHGRSFCQRSFVLHRGLPSVIGCGIWEVLALQPPVAESWALVTDLGNDLIYGRPIDMAWERVLQVFRKIAELKMPLTFVRPPLERILQLSEARYKIIKQMLFPGPTVPWSRMCEQIVELDRRATEYADHAGARILTPKVNWYGVDPIHIRKSRRLAAWNEIVSSWPFPDPPVVKPVGKTEALRAWQSPPLERSYWGRSYQTPQPCRTFADGSSLWQY
ncbi:hypothetical protein SAMN05421753_11445 [Planctomicrobium piriforme]|uniref:GDSL-like Lipase/Acylhydrolase family protein n=2 Tax=Planctomicrobium piriforme TaxID=1576369 RepID=A0A1I3MLX0_9PLAN|nr:hypothetical protein SAMN05421753_11445 [Planctomicrobium piriforme]